MHRSVLKKKHQRAIKPLAGEIRHAATAPGNGAGQGDTQRIGTVSWDYYHGGLVKATSGSLAERRAMNKLCILND